MPTKTTQKATNGNESTTAPVPLASSLSHMAAERRSALSHNDKVNGHALGQTNGEHYRAQREINTRYTDQMVTTLIQDGTDEGGSIAHLLLFARKGNHVEVDTEAGTLRTGKDTFRIEGSGMQELIGVGLMECNLDRISIQNPGLYYYRLTYFGNEVADGLAARSAAILREDTGSQPGCYWEGP